MRAFPIAVLVAAAVLAGCASTDPDDGDAPSGGDLDIVHVAYKSWKRSVDVDLVARTLARSRTEYTYPSRTSGTPSSARTLSEPEVEITREQARAVAALVFSSGFMDLGPEHGAPEDQRFYPYRITVRAADGAEKTVLFRSNPSYEGKPEAFANLEEHLLKLGADD